MSDAKKFEQAQITLRDNRDCKISNQQLWREYTKQRFASERNPSFDIYEHFALPIYSRVPTDDLSEESRHLFPPLFHILHLMPLGSFTTASYLI